MITRRNLLQAAPVAAAGALALSACGGSGGGSGEGGSGGSLSWMALLHTPTTPDAAGPVHSGLAEETGQDFEIQWVPDASKEEKMNAALASGSVADITSITNLTNSSIRSGVTSGLFWDVEPFLGEFENLKGIDPKTIESARLDGVLYGVPFQKPLARYGVLVRQDWLDELGLDVPHTIEDLGEVAKAFAEGDPTGTGQSVTGFIDREESFKVGFRSLAGYFGAGETFQLDEAAGKIIPACTSEAWMEAMEWYQEVYAAGGVNQEFITTQKQNQQQAIAQDKGGIVVTGLFEAKNYAALADSINPDSGVEWTLINDITYADVPRRIVSDTGGGMGGLFSISTQSVKSEDEVREVLAFADALMTEEVHNLMTNGIEGTHYEVDGDGAVNIIDEALWEQEVQPYSSSRLAENAFTYKSSNEYVNLANEMMEENSEYAITNPVQSLNSETFNSQWATIEQGLNDVYNKFMMGQATMGDYEAAIESARGQGLDDIISEYTEAYEEFNA
ncbi:lipoprotein [Brachybacterium faecium]|uniref:ABC-type sugar transport system, periplasmic component n=1 Tax=Brachybacterium faecium (strain ATCC 43885 / DSM 4810 / JCM 11609 / LMG 19847 / NBRC 14762 / NCIMB 9860 / 6-10) TaxID=446465 RepID=C7MA12_BRAFD|nr:extracellular solute-binding protein [Brachybacterium faecium]ACU86682.1 ABC-type sugar transport system, periplasmic component [Brachybacterium faecium DSM 4810]SLM92567.1 lipoprotein [Brachybacterium faecium]HJG50681.1 extracellular solute-binding protein [Brachybacterium faecium]